jgi:hypothetical protein
MRAIQASVRAWHHEPLRACCSGPHRREPTRMRIAARDLPVSSRDHKLALDHSNTTRATVGVSPRLSRPFQNNVLIEVLLFQNHIRSCTTGVYNFIFRESMTQPTSGHTKQNPPMPQSLPPLTPIIRAFQVHGRIRSGSVDQGHFFKVSLHAAVNLY